MTSPHGPSAPSAPSAPSGPSVRSGPSVPSRHPNGPSVDEALLVLRRVEFLQRVDEETLREVAARARRQTFPPGGRIVAELEFGADVFVILRGEAEVSVEPRQGDRQTIGRISAGSAFGEMSSLTGELRSATVTALDEVEVLVISDAAFDGLRARRPEVAVVLVRVLATRLAVAERTVDALSAVAASPEEQRKSLLAVAGMYAAPRRGSLARVWRELVVNRQRDLPFLTLAAFVLTLVLVRTVVYAAFRWEWSPLDVLRTAYIGGFALLGGCSLAALLTFRPAWRRSIAALYGVGCALVFNSLGVTLAFDIFYKDIFTPDPTVPFDVERLYRRTEPIRAIVIGLVVLVQAVWLRPFYRRAAFLVATRARARLTRRGRGAPP